MDRANPPATPVLACQVCKEHEGYSNQESHPHKLRHTAVLFSYAAYLQEL